MTARLPEYLKTAALSSESFYRRFGEEYMKSLENDRKFKTVYARALIFLLYFQIIAIYLLTFLQGFEVIALDGWELEIVVTGPLAETAGLIYVIVKHLFPATE